MVVLIPTVDTYVIVILIGKFHAKYELSSVDIWVPFGTGKHFHHCHINTLEWKSWEG